MFKKGQTAVQRAPKLEITLVGGSIEYKEGYYLVHTVEKSKGKKQCEVKTTKTYPDEAQAMNTAIDLLGAENFIFDAFSNLDKLKRIIK